MKRYLWLLVIFLMACGPSANQLAGEKAFYEAKIALSRQTSSQPVFEMTSGDPTKPIVLENVSAIRVFQLPAQAADDTLKQYEQKDYAQKWVGLIGTTISVAAPWLGAWGIVHEISGIAGSSSTTYNQSVSGTGNTATTRTSTMAAGNITGDGNSLSGMTEINDSYNPTTFTTTTTTNTDDHSTASTTTPVTP